MNNYDTNSDISWELARDAYFMAEDYYGSLGEKDKHLLEQIRAIKPGTYDANWQQVRLIADIHCNNATDAFCDIFKFGFLKGQRAERARMKKKAHKTTKKERVLN